MNTIRIAWWIIAASVGGFLALAALSGWFLRDQIFQTFQDPGEPFQTYEPPDAADYTHADAWFLRGAFSEDNLPEMGLIGRCARPGPGSTSVAGAGLHGPDGSESNCC